LHQDTEVGTKTGYREYNDLKRWHTMYTTEKEEKLVFILLNTAAEVVMYSG
jgi:hypothetical protein